jgi:hypothetical protein
VLVVTVQTAVASVASTTRNSLRTQAAASASGTLALASGTTTSLTGTYDTSTNTLTLNGAGYQLTGQIEAATSTSPGGFLGTYTGPDGSSGSFELFVGTNSAPVKVYCGTFSGAKSGIWNMLFSGNDVSGLSCRSDKPECDHLTGSLSGTHFHVTGSGGDQPGTGTGDITGESVAGTWTSPSNSGGTFSGSKCS